MDDAQILALRRRCEAREDGETVITLDRETALAMLNKLDACKREQARVNRVNERNSTRIDNIERTRPLPSCSEGVKILATVELESDGRGGWEDLEGAPLYHHTWGWMPHPATKDGGEMTWAGPTAPWLFVIDMTRPVMVTAMRGGYIPLVSKGARIIEVS